MNEHKPALTVLYFKNNWNPECSRQFTKDFLSLFLHETAFTTFTIDTWTDQGERTKKYYSIRYEPTFLFLSDGFDIKRYIGGCPKALKESLELVKEFRKSINWGMGMNGSKSEWENYHDDHMKRWRTFNQEIADGGLGTILFDRN